MASPPKYSAPALQKGLDILEYLSKAPDALTVTQLADRLGRSVQEIYRTVLILSERGYVHTTRSGVVPTTKAFELGTGHPAMTQVLQVAAPALEQMNRRTGQSSYLSIESDRNIIVIATCEAAMFEGMTVPKGTRLPVLTSTAGLVHFAFAPQAMQDKWKTALKKAGHGDALDAFLAEAAPTLSRGWLQRRHRQIDFVTELSVPVFAGGRFNLVTSVPFLRQAKGDDIEITRLDLVATAAHISRTLRATPERGPLQPPPARPAPAQSLPTHPLPPHDA